MRVVRSDRLLWWNYPGGPLDVYTQAEQEYFAKLGHLADFLWRRLRDRNPVISKALGDDYLRGNHLK